VLAGVFHDPAALTRELERLADIIRRTCRITTRGRQPNLLQLVNDPQRQPLPGVAASGAQPAPFDQAA
jgi:hypothetical protein